MAEVAANLNDKSTAITATIQEFLALYPLDSVAIEKGNKTYDLVNGEKMYLDGIELQGYDEDNVDFFGFDQGWGQWELQGEEVKPGTDDSGNATQSITKGGGTLKLTTFDSGSQRIDATGFDNTSDLTFNLKWVLDEDSYSKVRWNKHTNGITEDEAEAIDTPIISINVSSTTKDVKSISVSGECEAPYGESVNLSKELDVEVKDSNDANISVPIFWEDNTTDGDRYISENGDTKFPAPGDYKVRAYTMKNAQKIISGWITVKVKEKANLTEIKLAKPDFDEADLTLTKEYPTRSFDLNSMVRYYDQFNEEWKGTEADPQPKPEFSVRKVMGKSSNPEIDENGMLTVYGAGTYEISATAQRVIRNSDNESETTIVYNIEPIRITITQEDWLDDIIMTEPSIERNELNLKDKKTPVTIKNLKQYLEYYNQNGDVWEGKKPTVRFTIDGETAGAEIKGSYSDGYTFYAYEPGRYTVQPIANGYIINPIFIYVGEDRELTIKTNDPPQLALSMDVGSVSVDLNRFVDYTTQFGGKWTGTEPVLDFKLDADVTGARIDNGEVSQFSADKAGRYYVHVTPRKASEYGKEIDDIVIDVTKKREIHFVALDFDGVGMDDRVIGEDGKYTLAGLSKYLIYADGELEEFTANEIANYRYPMPKITGYTVSKVDEEGKEQTGGTDSTWKIIEADGDYTFETQEPGIYLVIPTIQTPEGEENNKVATIGGGIVVLPKGMSVAFGDLIEQIAAIIADDYSGYDEGTQDALSKFEKFIKSLPHLSGEQIVDNGTKLIGDLIENSPKTAAKKELQAYKDPAAYRDEQKQELDKAIEAGKENINSARGKEAVDSALSAAKAEIDKIKTDAQYTAEELAEAKTKAKEELAAYKNPAAYRDAQKTELSDAIKSGNEDIDAAEDKDAMAAALEKAKAAIDKIKTDAELAAEEEAEEKAANAKGADGTAYGKGAGAKAVEKAITSLKSDADPKGTKIAPLLLHSKSQGKNSIKLAWKKVSGAKTYVVYGNACGKKYPMKKLATRTTNSFNVKKIAKKLKAKTYHKFIVVALDKDNKVVTTSAIIHVATKGNLKKAANPAKVVVKAKVNAKGKAIKKLKALKKTVVKKGKKVALKASVTKAKKTKVVKRAAIRFMSSNTKIATVSKKGVVKGIKKGKATIYAYAQNGVYKSVKITVK